MIAVGPCETVAKAWAGAVRAAIEAPKGRRPHVVMGVTGPLVENDELRSAVDAIAEAAGWYPISTVAETIFPASLYPDPRLAFDPEDPSTADRLDRAATILFDSYRRNLPILRTEPANSRGTYFGRMISWPDSRGEGVNQIAARIKKLRSLRTNGTGTNNTLDIDVAGDGDATQDAGPVRGLQVYRASDTRPYGFPCLTHIDFTLLDGHLHCTAVYRHHYLLEKAYGNMIGLAGLQAFIAAQGGFEPGELVVHATLADSQPTSRQAGGEVARLLDRALTIADTSSVPT